MGTPPDDQLLERFRAEALHLRSVLVDRTTGLPAYPVWIDELRTLLETRRHVGVLHLDVPRLEWVESLYGWQVLDGIVAKAAEVLRASVGVELPTGTRLALHGVGADRFVAFIAESGTGQPVDLPYLETVGRALRARLTAAFAGPEFAGLSPRLAFRSGHSLLSENPFYRFERRVAAAVEEAGTYHARREGGRDPSWESELHRLIEDAAVSTLFQPLIDLASGEIVGFEALSRGPAGSAFELPAPMFALSERFGLALDLDRLCRANALRELPRLAGRMAKTKLFLNVLPGGLADPDWLGGGVEALLHAAGLAPCDLVLEVSERRADADSELFESAARKIRQAGFGLALDDVGTGYATLGTLERVRPDYLKMDVSLVRGIHESPIKQDILGSLVHIARRMGAEIVAEGIEAEEETRALRAAGAHLGQGFLYARPAPPGPPHDGH